VNDYIDFPIADILHPSGNVATTPLPTINEEENDMEIDNDMELSLLSIAAMSEFNAIQDPHLDILTQDEVALVNEQAASATLDKDFAKALQQDFKEFMLQNAPLAAMTPSGDVAPHGLSALYLRMLMIMTCPLMHLMILIRMN
jgi:hypothetical protein